MYISSPGEFAREQFEQLARDLTDESEAQLRVQVAILAALVSIDEHIAKVDNHLEQVGRNVSSIDHDVSSLNLKVKY